MAWKSLIGGVLKEWSPDQQHRHLELVQKCTFPGATPDLLESEALGVGPSSRGFNKLSGGTGMCAGVWESLLYMIRLLPTSPTSSRSLSSFLITLCQMGILSIPWPCQGLFYFRSLRSLLLLPGTHFPSLFSYLLLRYFLWPLFLMQISVSTFNSLWLGSNGFLPSTPYH